MRTKGIWILTLGLMTSAFMLPSAAADGAGLSGQCWSDDATRGGQDEARVDTDDPGIVTVPGLIAPNSAVDAVVEFAIQTVLDGGQPGTACKRYDCHSECGGEQTPSERWDYLEVDVTVLGTFMQVCYDGQNSAHFSGDCPTTPTGPGDDPA